MLYFREKSARERGRVQSTRSLGRAIKYLRLRDVHHKMWRAKVFSGWSERRRRGVKNLSRWVSQ